MSFFGREKKYIKEEDPIYIGLLQLSCISNNCEFSNDKLKSAIRILNQLPQYLETHWRLIPLLKSCAVRLGIFEQLELDVRHILISETKKGIVRQLAHSTQLKRVIQILSEQNIPVILLKGTAFSNTLYSEEFPRLSNDIDILVKKENQKEALTLIAKEMDYQEKPVPGVLGDSYEVSFVPKANIGAALDLHLAIYHEKLFNLNQDMLWSSAIPHPFYENKNVLTLSPEHSLISLAIHAFNDLEFCNYGLVDVFWLLNSYKVDDNLLLKYMRDFEVEHVVYFLLLNLEKFIGYQNPIKNRCSSHFRIQLMTLITAYDKNKSKNGQKTLMYRFIQLLSQYAFASNVSNPIAFQINYFGTRVLK